MRFTKATKRVLSLSMAAAVAATTVAVPVVSQKADAASKYSAYLCFASKSYNGVAANHNDANRAKGVFNGARVIRRLPVLRLRMLHSRKVNSNLPYLYPVRT